MWKLLPVLFGLFFLSACEYIRPDNSVSAEQVQAEEERPTIFVYVTGTVEADRMNCAIQNMAYATAYKNIDVTIYYFSSTKELIRAEQHLLDVTAAPSAVTPYLLAINQPPMNFSSIYISVKNAEPVSAQP
ncbi:MAG: hypothetical protein IPL12_21310 [Bacteroidetes bacterium]|nr:hypothetical protein [Bacteroidota bacterium]MBK8345596.1 hypothetical protein [Bacteroidota bacterium]